MKEAVQFLDQLDQKSAEKILYNIRKAQVVNDSELFKKLRFDIWEFRTFHRKAKYRLFAFWDKSEGFDTVVMTTHGLIKKSDKTPAADLEKAERLREQYFEQKHLRK